MIFISGGQAFHRPFFTSTLPTSEPAEQAPLLQRKGYPVPWRAEPGFMRHLGCSEGDMVGWDFYPSHYDPVFPRKLSRTQEASKRIPALDPLFVHALSHFLVPRTSNPGVEGKQYKLP